VGHAELGTSPLPGAQPYPGRAARVAALAKPMAVGVAAASVALCAGAVALLWFAPAQHPYGYDISGDLVVAACSRSPEP
jgi:hypothetical protein